MSRFFRSVVAGVVVVAVLGGVEAQQPNSAAASLTVSGVDVVPVPMTVTIWSGVNPELEFRVAGTPSQPFVLARAQAGTAAAGLPLPIGLLDLDLSLGFQVVMDGISFSTGSILDFLANTGPAGAQSLTLAVPPNLTLAAGAFQAAVVEPGNPNGLRLTAATELNIAPGAPAAFFVSRSTGTAGGAGTQASPFLTISQGIAASVAAGFPRRPVFIAHTLVGGLYSEDITLADGVSLIGGFDPLTWTITPGAYSRNIAAPGAMMSGTGIHALTTIANIELTGGAAVSPNFTALALRLIDCSSALTFSNCRFDAANSTFGAIGGSGTPGANGQNGGSGAGITAGQPGGPVSSPVRGGVGGGGSFSNGGNGGHGLPLSQPGIFGSGGSGGTFNGALDGGNGASGVDGGSGVHGTPSVAGGVVSPAGIWSPGPTGTSGASGISGGGGGGGGGGAGVDPLIGNSLAGGGGGGGGQGGAGGGGGGAGANGGASFGVFLHDASPAFFGCRFRAGLGGAGGAGGNGATGGSGGSGGLGAAGASGTINQAGDGGNGGSGGDGGGGGGGPGGAGGPSFCVYRSGTSNPTLVNASFIPGQGGPGGPGGLAGGSTNQASTGPTGPAGIIF